MPPLAVVTECILPILDFYLLGGVADFLLLSFSSRKRRFRRKKRAAVQCVLVLPEHSIAVPRVSIDPLYFILYTTNWYEVRSAPYLL